MCLLWCLDGPSSQVGKTRYAPGTALLAYRPGTQITTGTKPQREIRSRSSERLLKLSVRRIGGKSRQALASRGFDLAGAFLHADMPGHDRLVYDLMELHRPTIDGLVLDFSASTMLHTGDFSGD